MTSFCPTVVTADDAVAASIARAAMRFGWLETASTGDLPIDLRLSELASIRTANDPNVPPHTEDTSDRKQGPYPAARSGRSASGSNQSHSIVEMDSAQSLVALTNNLVTIPNGSMSEAHPQPPLRSTTACNFPEAIETSRRASLSEMSVISGLTEQDFRSADESYQVSDYVVDAILAKLSTVTISEGHQVEDVVETLASLVKSNRHTTSKQTQSHSIDAPHGRSNSEGRIPEHGAALQRPQRTHNRVVASTFTSNKSRNGGGVSPKTLSSTSISATRPTIHCRKPQACPSEKQSNDSRLIMAESSSTFSPEDVCDPRQLLGRGSSANPATRDNDDDASSQLVPSKSELLAIGWRKARDADSGRYYYYTLDHSQVVWENPLAMKSPSEAITTTRLASRI